ncbi:MAG: phosphate ABC transporter substrate-binding protein [Chthoniobacterales bacterium]|nr:phosphate ABC transporter substrate-binding protein [Chthoniobacterales bacterium]
MKPAKLISTLLLTVALCAAAINSSPAQTVKVDAAIPGYETASGVSGNLNSIGSDTLNNLMTLWAEGFKAKYPNVNIQIEGKGSSTAPPALISGTAQLGPMSRAMKNTEIDEFEKKYGYKPTEIKVAVDALAVFVHKDNPIKGLTLQQVDSIFSSTHKFGGKEINNWGEVGLTGEWASKPMSLYGRNSASGTYGYFKEVALNKGDFRPSVKEQPGSSSVVQGVGSDLAGIGYSGIGYITSGVRAVPLGEKEGNFVEANVENSLSGEYPLARFLYVYVNRKPGAPMDKLTAEFLKFIASQEGQEVVVKDGYFPIPKAVSDEVYNAVK